MAEQLRFGFGRLSSRQFAPVTGAVRGAQRYAETAGMARPDPEAFGDVHVDPQFGFRVQAAYRKAEQAPQGQGIRRSYDALRSEVGAQYEHMTRPVEQGGMGIRHEVVPRDPYADASEMAWDVRNRRLKTFATASTGPHHFLSNEENDKLRAVHDVFGHAATGRGFSRHGEEAAYRAHAEMFSHEARPALASETRGQNSYLNFSPQGGFPEQSEKLIQLPTWAESTFSDRRRTQGQRRAEGGASGVFTASGQPARR